MGQNESLSVRSSWKIQVAGYGIFDFEGTEEEAEEMRRHKANWEQGIAKKWKVGRHVHARDCYDDAGPGAGGVSLICNKIEGLDPI